MGAAYSAAATYHSRTDGPNTDTWSVTFWARRMADPNAISLIYGHHHTSGTHEWTIRTAATGDTVDARWIEDGGDHTQTNLHTLVTNTWAFYKMTRDNATDALALKSLQSGESSFTASLTATGEFTPNAAMQSLRIGNVDAMSMEIAAVKIWSGVAISDADALTERSTLDVTTNTGSEWANYQFANGALTTDSSGNARTLTANGTPTYVSDPSDIASGPGSPPMFRGT